MLYQLRKISMEQWFIILSFTLSIILSFLLGYTMFRYWQIEFLKSPIEIFEFKA